MLAIGFERYGNLEKLKDDPIHHLYEVYVKINQDAKQDPTITTLAAQYFARMEQGKSLTMVSKKKKPEAYGSCIVYKR